MIRENDPCDEWPRSLVLKAVGLQPCGCRLGIVRCVCVARAGLDHSRRSLLGEPRGGYDFGHMVERAPMAE